MKALRWIDVAAALMVAWALLAATPLAWWGFEPGEIKVGDTSTERAAPLVFQRKIARTIRLSYSLTVRRVEDRRIVCESHSGVIRYHPESTLPDDLDMAWWAPGDIRCATLFPPGAYMMETCWTADNLLFGILPPKTVCRESNVFNVSQAAPNA